MLLPHYEIAASLSAQGGLTLLTMTEVMDKNFLEYIKRLKEENNLKIVDSHTHPLDVMGIVYVLDEVRKPADLDFLKPGMMENMRFGRLANFLSRFSFRFLPKAVLNEIKAAYNNPDEKRLLDEMDQVLIDKIALLAIEPWVSAKQVREHYNSKRFLILGSIDINKVETGEIESRIKEQINNYKIIGIKLHPNLQNFKPQPSHNSKEISEKLKLIYRTAEKYNLYLLFHGGLTSFTKYINPKFESSSRSKDNAILENFCDDNGESEIFGKYDIPIIIAHLGHFGKNKLNGRLMKTIAEKHKNVYFDTAAVSPAMIKDAIEILGSKRLILGSDAIYNRMIFAIYFVYLAAQKVESGETEENILMNILGRNFERILREILQT